MRDARLAAAGADVEARVEGRRVVPEDLAGRGVKSEDVALGGLVVHDAAVLDRRPLLGTARRVVGRTDTEVGRPRLLQRADVRRRDLRQRRVAVVLEVAAVGDPVVPGVGVELCRGELRRQRYLSAGRDRPTAIVAAPAMTATVTTPPTTTFFDLRKRLKCIGSSPRQGAVVNVITLYVVAISGNREPFGL